MTRAKKTEIYERIYKTADEFVNGNGFVTEKHLYDELCFILDNWKELTGKDDE